LLKKNDASSFWVGLGLLTTPFRIGMFRRYAKVIDRHLSHPKLREVMYQYATYSGASPFAAPATLAVIPFAESYFGGWYPEGGMYRLAEALESLARRVGVDIRCGCAVEKISIDDAGRACGVRVASGDQIAADAVIVNADVVYAYRHLVDARSRPHRDDANLARLEPGGSGMVLLLGVDGTYPQLAHHTKFMPADYRSDLRAMFETRTVPEDPCIYVCASTRTDLSQAPDGCENLFVLCSAPALDGRIDWTIEGERYERQIIDTLEQRWGLADLSKRIVVRRRMTPLELRDAYNANAGSIYGISSNGLRQAFLRPPNRDRKIKGLYFAGGATHPGGGLPLVALSGKIAAEMACEDLGIVDRG
jgi:phytoene desaturase